MVVVPVALWVVLGSYYYRSSLFYFFSSERLIIIGPTLCSAFVCRGHGPFQIVTTRPHKQTEYLCICYDDDKAYLNFVDRESSWYTRLVPWLMHPVAGADEILKSLPETPTVRI